MVWLVLLMGAVKAKHASRADRMEKGEFRSASWARPERDVLVRFVMFFVCLSAMFMTNSRGGVVVSLGVMVVTFMVYFGRDMPRGSGLVGALIACATVGALLLQILGGNVSSRIDLQGLSDAGRLSAYRSTLRIISDNPWFGTGLGTFAHALSGLIAAATSPCGGGGTSDKARRLSLPPR